MVVVIQLKTKQTNIMIRSEWSASYESKMAPRMNAKLDPLHEIFIQNVSHELRTPLALVLGYAELLGNETLGSLAPEQHEAMLIILKRAQDLQTIIDRVGILLTSDDRVKEYQPVSLTDVALAAAAVREAQAEKSGTVFQFSFQPNIPPVFGDRDHLQHMVDCLLENAIKFAEINQTVSVELHSHGDWVYLSVSDSGIGMTQQQSEAIINNQFYQTDGTATRRYEGMGLGLTVVKTVLQAHGGVLDITSQLGQGSRFAVKLPVYNLMPTIEPPVSEPTTEAAAAKPHRILIVDDEQHVALVLKQALKRLPNCQITTTTSAKEALKLAIEEPFDLLLTDYSMPDMNGVSLAQQVRQHSPHTIVLLLTAYSTPQINAAAAEANIRQVLNKPVPIEEIRHLTQGLLQPLSLDCSEAKKDSS